MTQKCLLKFEIKAAFFVLNLLWNFRFYNDIIFVISECCKNLLDVNLGLKCEIRIKMLFNL